MKQNRTASVPVRCKHCDRSRIVETDDGLRYLCKRGKVFLVNEENDFCSRGYRNEYGKTDRDMATEMERPLGADSDV